MGSSLDSCIESMTRGTRQVKEKIILVSLDDIQKADRIMHGNVLRTPLVYSPYFSKQIEGEVYLKLENLQKAGSFKPRGAIYKIQTHLNRMGPRAVVAASAGNHAQGVALAPRQASVPATIVMPK